MRALLNEIAGLSAIERYGRVHSAQGLLVEVAGPVHAMSIGSRVTVAGRDDQPIDSEVVGFRDRLARCMPFGVLDGVRIGCPAVVSRTMPDCVPGEARDDVRRARPLMSTYSDMEELIRLGAYRPGSDPVIDEAMHYHPPPEAFLSRRKGDSTSLGDGYAELARILMANPDNSNEMQRHGS